MQGSTTPTATRPRPSPLLPPRSTGRVVAAIRRLGRPGVPPRRSPPGTDQNGTAQYRLQLPDRHQRHIKRLRFLLRGRRHDRHHAAVDADRSGLRTRKCTLYPGTATEQGMTLSSDTFWGLLPASTSPCPPRLTERRSPSNVAADGTSATMYRSGPSPPRTSPVLRHLGRQRHLDDVEHERARAALDDRAACSRGTAPSEPSTTHARPPCPTRSAADRRRRSGSASPRPARSPSTRPRSRRRWPGSGRDDDDVPAIAGARRDRRDRRLRPVHRHAHAEDHVAAGAASRASPRRSATGTRRLAAIQEHVHRRSSTPSRRR